MAKRTVAKPPEPDPNIHELHVDQLLFDEQNPRLAAYTEKRSQDALLRFLWTHMAAEEIAFSIAKNRFFQEERLFVVPANATRAHSDHKKYIVVEGNRRLAAVKVLIDAELRRELGATDVPPISEELRRELQHLPVSVYKRRKDLWQYFGFRHINGPKPWDSYSKAKYISEVHDDHGIALDEIADSIGDRHSTVQRLYRGLKLMQQAETQGGWDPEDRTKRRLAFSHIYTAAAQPEFQKFLGIDEEGSLKPNPVTKANLAKLGELLVWLYGSKSQDKEPLIISQNPNLNQLRKVISTRKGLDAIRSGFSLERALNISVGDEVRFREALVRAREDLQQAKATVTLGYKGEKDLIETLQAILVYGESLQQEMMQPRARVGGSNA